MLWVRLRNVPIDRSEVAVAVDDVLRFLQRLP
jgi:hypothetical protein